MRRVDVEDPFAGAAIRRDVLAERDLVEDNLTRLGQADEVRQCAQQQQDRDGSSNAGEGRHRRDFIILPTV